VSDLTSAAFHIFEDEAPQTIQFFVSEDRPVAIGLVVDNSTSMYNKRDAVIEAAAAFADSSNRDDQLFLVNFNEHVTYGLPEDLPFTSDLGVLRQALQTIGARGQTALYDAVSVALDHLTQSKLDQRVLIVVSDGGDNRSRLSFDEVLGRALRSNVVIYTVGLVDVDQDSGNKKALTRLADATGGFALFPAKLAEVRTVLQQISIDVRHRYTIGYISTNPRHDGTFRQVRVTAIDPIRHAALQAKARPGYLASSRE
jgi:VWFA-related protein